MRSLVSTKEQEEIFILFGQLNDFVMIAQYQDHRWLASVRLGMISSLVQAS